MTEARGASAPRIIYVAASSAEPSGGLRVSYGHIATLRRHGFDAHVLEHRPEDRPAWLDVEVPVLYSGVAPGVRIRSADILVIAESGWRGVGATHQFRCRRFIFCQNHFQVLGGLTDYPDLAAAKIDRLFCSSEYMARQLARMFGLSDVPVINYAIDMTLFRPREKRLQIAFMPRKRAADAEFIRRVFRATHPRFADVPWVEISGRPQSVVAGLLGESAVFLSLSRREGFGLPPVEAMASGCLVAGFHGIGGLDYATAENGHWAAEEDLLDCALCLGRAVAAAAELGAEAERLRRGGEATAARYSVERAERELVAFWRQAIAEPPP